MSTVYTPEYVTPRADHPQPLLPEPWTVRSLRHETHDTFTLSLTPVRTRVAFSFLPGQFNMLYVFGVGEVPISISGDPARSDTLVHTVRAVGMVTRAMAKLRRGQVLGVRGPYGTAWPVREARGRDVVIAAGGISLAPLRPALYHILANRQDFGRVSLLYGARTPRDLLYVRELEDWGGRFDVDLQVTVDAAQEDWRGNVGVVTTLVPRTQFEPANTLAMMCGPEIMMRFLALELGKRGVPQEDIFISMERNMKCAVGYCGHCQYGPTFICQDGPVFPYSRLERLLAMREV